MGFFDSFEEEPEPVYTPPPPKPAWMKPDDEVAVSLACSIVLAHNEKAAIAVTGLRVFSAGFEFQLSQYYRRDDDKDGDPFDMSHRRTRRIGGPGGLRVGIEYADGRQASNVERPPMPYAPMGEVVVVHRSREMPQLVLMPAGGGGGPSHHEMTYWVWPLPESGPARVVCDWNMAGIAECSAELSTDQILDASTQVTKLWPAT